MGCHTWFYKKTELDSDDKILDRAQELWNVMETNGIRLQEEHLLMVQHAIDYEYVEWLVNFVIGNNMGLIIKYHKGVLYQELDTYHDLFRVSSFPETILTSYEETTQFIEENSIGGQIYWNELKQFWEEHPDGIIEVG